jgi:hypothetical protein
MSTGPGNQIVTPPGVFGLEAIASLLAGPWIAISKSQAIPQPPNAQSQRQPGKYAITKTGSIAALTLATPVSGLDDGVLLQILNVSGLAHTITCTAGKINDGNSSGHNTVWTFNADVGGCLILEAYQGVWYARSETGGSLTS